LGTPDAANIPGSRENAVGWADGAGNLWLFGGSGNDCTTTFPRTGYLNDLWEFDTSTREWTWKGGSGVLSLHPGYPGVYGTLGVPAAGNVPGGRHLAASWTDKSGHFWLFGGYGIDSAGNVGILNDLWEFDPSSIQWTWVGGDGTISPTANSNGARLGVYGTLGIPAAGNTPGGRAIAFEIRLNHSWYLR
jgi:N-acetylneuraminic acid mutarotase